MGEVHYDLTLPEALEAYEKIPSERMHGLKCVGFDLKDGSDYEGMQSLMIEGKIQKEFLNSIPGFRENSYVQNAISRVEKYLEERHPNLENPLESNKKVEDGFVRQRSASQPLDISRLLVYASRIYCNACPKHVDDVRDVPTGPLLRNFR